MDFDRMRMLAQEVSNTLPTCDLDEIFFMVRAMSQAVDVVKDNDTDGLDILDMCEGLLQDFIQEIHKRIVERTVIVVDGNKIKNTLENLRPLKKETLKNLHSICGDIYNATVDQYSKGVMKSGSQLIEKEMLRRGIPFKPIGLKQYTVLDVPSPEDIINGKSPEDIPNT